MRALSRNRPYDALSLGFDAFYAGSAGSGANSMRQPGLEREPPAATPFAGTPPSKWPIVRMDDGGRPVHWLQVGAVFLRLAVGRVWGERGE